MSRAVLVTGGAGYVGSHACKALAPAGYQPIAYDNLVHGHEWAVRWGPLERGDILDRERLNEVLDRYHPEAVLHFAGFACVGESVAKPAKYYRNNVSGSLVLLDSLVQAGIDRFVFSSTCATYGIPRDLPIREDHPQNPVNPYGFSGCGETDDGQGHRRRDRAKARRRSPGSGGGSDAGPRIARLETAIPGDRYASSACLELDTSAWRCGANRTPIGMRPY